MAAHVALRDHPHAGPGQARAQRVEIGDFQRHHRAGRLGRLLARPGQGEGAAIGPELKRRGLIFTGIDVIGDYMTEINVTSPTGIREVKRFGGADIAKLVWDSVEAKVRR